MQEIPAQRPATHILTIVADSSGNVWGSCAIGLTIFRYDPHSGRYWNSQQVGDRGGEVYGMRFIDGKLFLSSYARGDHTIYDPEALWDQYHNVNPVTLAGSHADFCRPTGRSVVGPDGGFWTGWMVKYGVFGGGLSRVDPATRQIQTWYDPVPGQALAGLAADDSFLYFSTYGGANGCEPKTEPFHFVVWDPQRGPIHTIEFAEGRIPGPVACVNGRTLIALDGEVLIFNPQTLSLEGSIDFGQPCSYIVESQGRCAVIFGERSLQCLEPVSRATGFAADLPGKTGTACITPSGDLYFTVGSGLYRFKDFERYS